MRRRPEYGGVAQNTLRNADEPPAISPYTWVWLRYAWDRWLAPYYTGGPVVDCGCGVGTVAGVLRSFGVDRVIGVDLDHGCLLRSRRCGIEVLQADLAHPIPLRGVSTDIIMISHVLEHIDNGVQLLSSAAGLLRPGGAIIVLTPNWKRQLTCFYDDPTHCRPYTRMSLDKVLRAAGLQPRVMLSHNVGYRLGRTQPWRLFPRLCFTGDALFAIAERNGRIL